MFPSWTNKETFNLYFKQEFQVQTGEDKELSRALALSLEKHNGQLKTTELKLKTQPRQMAHGGWCNVDIIYNEKTESTKQGLSSGKCRRG